MELGRSGRPRSAVPGTLPSVGHLSPLAPHPPRPLPQPTGARGERTTVGGSFWKTPGVTRARGLAPRGVWTLLLGPQSFLESGRQAGSDRLAGKPH